jgi:hypothetical protein
MAGFSNRENMNPQIARQIGRELSDLMKNPTEGIDVLPCEAELTDIQAIIHGT